MLFIFGVAGILQCAVLPGAILLKAIKLRCSLLQRLVYTFAVSLIANYLVASLLIIIRLYLQPVVLGILLLELVTLVYLYRRELQGLTLDSFSGAWNDFSMYVSAFLPRLEDGQAGFRLAQPVALLLSALGALGSLWAVWKLFVYNLGTVFNAWDVVVSWNRWAAAWAANSFPLDSHFYPQLVPATWSTVYVAMGSLDVHFFAKALMPLFPLLLLVLLFDLGARFKQIGYFLAVILAQLLLKKFLGEELSNGYVDGSVAFFGLLPLHALLLARASQTDTDRKVLLILGAVFAAGASLAKQSGLYILAAYPVLVFFSMLWPVKSWVMELSARKTVLIYTAIASVPAAWYIYRAVLFRLGMDRAETGGLVQIASAAYGHIGLFEQILAALGQFDRCLFLFPLILLAIPLLDPLGRVIAAIIILPYPLLWAWGASYDTRNLALFIPFFAIVSGLAFQAYFDLSTRLLSKANLQKIRLWWAPVLVLAGILLGGFLLPDSTLRGMQTRQELMSFSPAINEKIYDVIKQDGPQTMFLTNYPVRYLPGLENNQIQFSFRDYPRFLQFASDPSIKYMLIPGPQLDGQIETYVNGKIADGSYHVLITDKNWVKFTLLEVIKR